MAAALAGAAALAVGGPICNLAISDCLSHAGPTTLSVPLRAIDLAPRFAACPDSVPVTTIPPPPSIAILIDQSLSVREYNDTGETRFTIARNVLDALQAAVPEAQVALIPFNEFLLFDQRDDKFFKAPFPLDPKYGFDSYVPLTPLARTFPDGRRGLDTLKALLRNVDERLVHQTERRDGSATDFVLAYRAAKAAFAEAKVPKNRQFILLITDGEAQDVGEIRAVDSLIKGLALPTTFALNTDQAGRGTATAWMDALVRKIAVNGYSTSNPRSLAFSVKTDPPDLGSLVRADAVDMQVYIPASPKSAVLSVLGKPIPVQPGVGKEFHFKGRIPLARDTTPVIYTQHYSVQYSDSSGKRAKDTAVVREYLLVRTASITEAPPGTALACREQADLAVFHQGNRLNRVRPRHTILEVRLTPPKGEDCLECRVGLGSFAAGDREALKLPARDQHFSAEISRASADALAGDGIWQNAGLDSLVMIYVNAENPLDSIRKSVLFEDRPSLLDMTRHGDIARMGSQSGPPEGVQWLIVGAGDLDVRDEAGRKCCRPVPGPLDQRDSTRYVGVTLSASRAFRFTAQVFSSLGENVSKVDFTLSDAELGKLPPGREPGTRILKILWNNRSASGDLAGTGAYIIKAKSSILRESDEPIPVSRAFASRVGVLR